MKNRKMLNFTAVVAKIMEVLMWLLEALMIIVCIVVLVAGMYVQEFIQTCLEDGGLTLSGYEINVMADGTLNTFGIAVLFIAAIICLALGALICRNIHHIFKAEMPFCDDNIRRVRQIGIYGILIAVAQLVLSLIVQLVSSNSIKVEIDFTTIFFGLVVLCLSQFFQYGAGLEKDVDGLV